MDEMFLNLTGLIAERYKGLQPTDPGAWKALEDFMNQVRATVLEETGMSCSAGIGPNMMMAKIASNVQKPNGQFCCPGSWEYDGGIPALLASGSASSIVSTVRVPGAITQPVNHFFSLEEQKPSESSGFAGGEVKKKSKLRDWFLELPAKVVPGIGPVTQKILSRFEIHTLQDVWENRGLVWNLFQPAQAQLLILATHGIEVIREAKAHKQSVSQERSFGKGVGDFQQLELRMREL